MPTYTPNYNLAKPLVNNATDQDLWGGYLNGDMDIIDTALAAAGVPVGTVLEYAGATSPAGFLLCYGQAVSRTTYVNLFTAIGTAWGIGDGTTTFNVPDKRGRTSFGKDDMGGTAANRITAAVSGMDGITLGAVGGDQNLQSHSHTATVNDSGHAHTGALFENIVGSSGGTAQKYYSNTSGTSAGANPQTQSASTGISVNNATTGAGASQNIPPGVISNFIIRY